jgi:hypothetical protein
MRKEVKYRSKEERKVVLKTYEIRFCLILSTRCTLYVVDES